jgi:hypothetical protein
MKFPLRSLTSWRKPLAYWGTRSFYAMSKTHGWVSAKQVEELLGIDRKTLFRYRDNGTLRLGPHFAAFPETRSRDSYRWNVEKVRKHLNKMAVAA